MLSRRDKIIYAVIYVLLAVAGIIIIVGSIDLFHIKFANQLEVRSVDDPYSCIYKLGNISEYTNYMDMPEKELRNLIEKEYRTLYFYNVKDSEVPEGSDAISVVIFRIVYMRSSYDNVYQYGIALAHELTHIKYQTANEAWVTLKTFKILYESKSKVLNEISLYLANEIFSYQIYGYAYNYDVSYYVADYLNLIERR